MTQQISTEGVPPVKDLLRIAGLTGSGTDSNDGAPAYGLERASTLNSGWSAFPCRASDSIRTSSEAMGFV